MLSFKQQQSVLKPILERQTNKHCADCGNHTPTWASLDFGVFVCSNCSGAHRALGPTITRIKSTNLDQWNREWLENMRIGNQEINQYWEADSKTAASKKPRWGATLDEHNRFVYDKYVRRKFVTDKISVDPLKAYKNGNYVSTPNLNGNQNHSKNVYVSSPGLQNPPSIVQLPKKSSQTVHVKKNSFSLLDDDHITPPSNHHQKNNVVQHTYNITNNAQKVEDQDEFTDYIDPVNHSTQVSHAQHAQHTQQTQQEQKDPSKMSFDELMKNPQGQAQNTHQNQHHQYQQHQQQHAHQQPQWNMYGQQNNYGAFAYQQGYAPQQQYVNQFAHNPYIGYAPHNPLHASYNFTGYNQF